MSRLFNKSDKSIFRPVVIALLCLIVHSSKTQAGKIEAKLNKPLKDLFNHAKHQSANEKMKIACTDCHTFSVKPISADPLGEGVPKGHLSVDKGVCHDCHRNRIPVARPNQCELCHENTWELRPLDHRQNWRFRHGRVAALDADSCKECHTEKSCTQCHTQRNTLKPSVHKPNFRLHHSIEARANPQSCVTCHTTTNSCARCHTKGY